MNITDILADIRNTIETKEPDTIETDYEIFLKNVELVNHPGYTDFLSELVLNSTDCKNKEVLELIAKFGANINMAKYIFSGSYQNVIQDDKLVKLRKFGLKNGKIVSGPESMCCCTGFTDFLQKKHRYTQGFADFVS